MFWGDIGGSRKNRAGADSQAKHRLYHWALGRHVFQPDRVIDRRMVGKKSRRILPPAGAAGFETGEEIIL